MAYQISTRFASHAFEGEAAEFNSITNDNGAPLAGTMAAAEYLPSDSQYAEVVNANLYSPGWTGLTGSVSSEWLPVTGSIPDAYYVGLRNLSKLALPALQLNGTLADDVPKLKVRYFFVRLLQ